MRGVLLHRCLRKDNLESSVFTGFYTPPGIAAFLVPGGQGGDGLEGAQGAGGGVAVVPGNARTLLVGEIE